MIVNQRHPFAQNYFTNSNSTGSPEAESFAIQSWNLPGSTSQWPGQILVLPQNPGQKLPGRKAGDPIRFF
jgi:hypothetical protein